MSKILSDSAAWLGTLPSTWSTIQIGSIYDERNEKVSDLDYPPLSVTMNGVVPQLDSAAKSADHGNRKLMRKGDFAINSRSDRRGAFGIAPQDGSCSLINIVLCPRNSEDARYYNYVFQTPLFPEEFYRWGNGIVADLWSTRWERMRKISFPMPTAEERTRIADYLDIECEKIDSVISAEYELIRSVEEYKQRIINETTTRGIAKNIPTKPSGYDWIGDIPSHWQMVYSKRLFSLRKERAYPDDEQLTSSQKYGIISQNDFMEKEGRQIVQVVTGEDILKHVEAGDFVISMRSFQGGLEYSNMSGKISSAYVMLIPNTQEIVPDYYKWLFKSKRYIRALQSTSNLVRDGQALRFSNFAQVYLPVFPKDEQTAIANYLNDKCGSIDSIIERSETLIAKLKQYKSELIYEYVTGKKEVPACQ